MFKINILEPNWYWILIGQCLVCFFFFVHHNLQILKTSVIKLRFTGISWALVINFFLLFFWWGTNYLHIILILTESNATSCLLICWFLFCFFPFPFEFIFFWLYFFVDSYSFVTVLSYKLVLTSAYLEWPLLWISV